MFNRYLRNNYLEKVFNEVSPNEALVLKELFIRKAMPSLEISAFTSLYGEPLKEVLKKLEEKKFVKIIPCKSTKYAEVIVSLSAKFY